LNRSRAPAGRLRLLREAGILCAALLVLAAAALAAQRWLFPRSAASPDIGGRLDDALGPLMSAEIRASDKVVDDPVVTEGLAAIVERLQAGLPGGAMSVEVLVIDSAEINAFTLPGRVVCIDTGLAAALDSAEEMAAVIGHELSHAANRDPLNQLARQLGMATIAGALTGGQGGGLATSMVQTMVNLRYGREAEDRADSFSVRLLARAGLPPESFAAALTRIKEAAKKDPGLLKYIDPHSPIDRRIARAGETARGEAFTPRDLPVDWKKLVEALPRSEGRH
jgi:predicted Zn-dependent protease